MSSVLVVDDNAENLYFLEALLEGNGFSVRSARNGAQALASALQDPPDLIVSDILMPEMDGYTLCREWRANDCLKEIPFIIYTATYTDKKAEELALSLGADRFVVKPQDPAVLMGIIHEVLADSRGNGVKACSNPTRSEDELLRDYNEVLFSKLEKKTADLEQANRELRESEGHFRQFLMECPVSIALSGPDGAIKLVNNQFTRTIGYTLDEIPTIESWWLLAYPDPAYRKEVIQSWQSATEKARSAGGVVRGPDAYRVTCRDGTVRTMEISGASIADRLLVTFIDLTARKRAEELVHVRDAQRTALLNTIPDIAWMKDAESRFLAVNEAFARSCGRSLEELPGLSDLDIWPEDLARRYQGDDREVIESRGGKRVEEPLVDAAGHMTWIETIKSPMFDAQGRAIGTVGIARDITERKRAEDLLRESERQFRAVLETMSLLGVMLDRTGKITLCNDFLLELTGWKRDEVLNRDWFDLFLPPDIHDGIKIDMFLKGIAAGEIPTPYENEIVTRSGERRLIQWSNNVLRDHAGAVVGVASIGEDITDRKEREALLRESEGLYRQIAEEWERRVRERTVQLENANRELEASRAQAEAATRAKSEFLANMSHELRTPLNSILGFSEIMRDGLVGAVSAQQKEYLNDIWESGSHLLRLINDILDISKIEAGKMELEYGAIDFNSLLGETLILFREKAARHRIGLRVEVAADLPAISADERKIKQVLINLLANALKFTPDGGEVGVEAVIEADDLRVTVRDTGIGIAPEDLGRLFLPFQQLDAALTKKYEGTGLGLNLCRQIVERHGGRIRVESTPDHGSRFIFTIPIAAAQAS